MHYLSESASLLAAGLIAIALGCSSKPVEEPIAAVANEPDVLEASNEALDEATVETASAAQVASAAGDQKKKAAPAQGAEDGPKPEAKAGDEKSSSKGSDKILLGGDELTKGIPGDGPLTNEVIQEWLGDPENHKVLQVELPLGLSAGASQMYIPEDNPLTRAKIELGRQLYFDHRVSQDFTVSCAHCHDPKEGFSRHTQFGVGILGQFGNRNSPVSYNRILSREQFWDGRAPSLEEQAKGPIANPIEMGNTHDSCIECLSSIEGYQLQFDKVFPDEGLTIDTVAKAIAAFERVLVTGPSPYDYYEPLRTFETLYEADLEDLETLKEEDPELYAQYEELKKASDEHPMSESAKRGRAIFFSDKGACTACHVGANFTDEKYHNLGVGMAAAEPDLGRFEVTKKEEDKGAFKTPTLRNVTLSAPYMHDGSLQTLEQVVEWYDKGGHPNPHLSDKMKKLNLTDQEKRDLVEFMKALEGDFPEIEAERIPPADFDSSAAG